MTPDPAVSVIITSFNSRDTIEACLQSLLADLQRAEASHEVIVVDDASTDGCSELVARRFPGVSLLRNKATLGYAKANNVGIKVAKGSMIFFLNADTVILPGCISALVQGLRHTNPAGVGPTLLNPDGTVQRSCWPFPMKSLIGNTLCLFQLRLWDDYRSWDHRADREVDCISSAALMVPRSVLERIGEFDESFWVYNVDIDWALRASRIGYPMLSVAAARVIHRGGASWGGASDRQYEDKMWSLSLLFRKHYGRLGEAFFHATVFVNSLLRIALWSIPSLFGLRSANRKMAEFGRVVRWSLFRRVGSSNGSAERVFP